MGRHNVYIKNNKEQLVSELDDAGITLGDALVVGAELILSDTIQRKVLQDRKEQLLAELAEVDRKLETLDKKLNINPERADEVKQVLLRIYHRQGTIPEKVKDNNRVLLGMNREEFNEWILKEVIEPYDAGEVEPIGLG